MTATPAPATPGAGVPVIDWTPAPTSHNTRCRCTQCIGDMTRDEW